MVDFNSQKGFCCMLHVTEMQVRLFTVIRQLTKLTVYAFYCCVTNY